MRVRWGHETRAPHGNDSFTSKGSEKWAGFLALSLCYVPCPCHSDIGTPSSDAGTLVLDFLLSKWWEIFFFLYKVSSLWHSVIAVENGNGLGHWWPSLASLTCLGAGLLSASTAHLSPRWPLIFWQVSFGLIT